MQFPSRVGRRILLFFGIPIAALLFLLAVSGWLSFTLTPLEKIYFPAYAASSVGAQLPGNRTTLLWVMKTAPKRKQVAATPEEVVPGPDPKLPANLSPKAIAEGWRD